MKMNETDWKKKGSELGALRRALHEKMGATLTQEEEANLKEELWHLELQSLELERTRPENTGIPEHDLPKVVQISMSQAIQIATAQQPGTVVECRLQGYREEGREYADYAIWIRNAERAESPFTRFIINAIDGRIMEVLSFRFLNAGPIMGGRKENR